MSTPVNTAPAGWFDDQQNPGMLRWWDGQVWTAHRAPAQVVVEQRRVYKTSHAFHLIMSIVTLGFWLPVWLVVGLMNASRS
jgi:hypothetical protein